MSILSGSGDDGFLSQCQGKKSVAKFKDCIMQSSSSFIRDISFESYERATILTDKTSAQIIIPEDGSVKLKKNMYKPTFKLEPLFSYKFCLYDKDFLLSVSNPFIIPRKCLTIKANSSVVGIPIQVLTIKIF